MESTTQYFPSQSRGVTDIGWLQSRHSFSFGEYYNPKRMGFRSLRVINDDIVAPGQGFDTHPHSNMEIISIVLRGAIQHKDSLGHTEILRPHEVQVMTAGRGIRHSEFNPSPTESLHLLQIWIEPHTRSLPPSYQQKKFDPVEQENMFRRVAGRVGDTTDGALPINQAADLFLATVSADQTVTKQVPEGRALYLHVATGEVLVNDQKLIAGDALSMEQVSQLKVQGIAEQSQLLLFELE